MSEQRRQSGGVGILGVLTIVFVVLKIVGTIDWSWVWVLAPFWIPVSIAVAALFVAHLLGGDSYSGPGL